jgi:hypothetical protein
MNVSTSIDKVSFLALEAIKCTQKKVDLVPQEKTESFV